MNPPSREVPPAASPVATAAAPPLRPGAAGIRHLPSAALPGITSTLPADGAVMSSRPSRSRSPSTSRSWTRSTTPSRGLLRSMPDQVLPTLVAARPRPGRRDRPGRGRRLVDAVPGRLAPRPVQETVATTTAADGTTQTQLVVTLPAGSPAMLPGTYQIEILPGDPPVAGTSASSSRTRPGPPRPAPIPIAAVHGPGPGVDARRARPTWGRSARRRRPSGAHRAVDRPIGRRSSTSSRCRRGAAGSSTRRSMADADRQPAAVRPDALRRRRQTCWPRATRHRPARRSHRSRAIPRPPGGHVLHSASPAAGNVPGTARRLRPDHGNAGDRRPGPARRPVPARPDRHPGRPARPAWSTFNLDHADALEPSPTGLDLTFSGPVDVSPLTCPTSRRRPCRWLTPRAGPGRSPPWTDDRPRGDRLSFLFDEPLPAGTYSLVVPSQGGLTDLAGNPVVGPAGNPPGVLATWTVAAPTGPADPDNLGVLWPGPANVTWSPGVSGSDTLGRRPGGRRSLRGDLPRLSTRCRPRSAPARPTSRSSTATGRDRHGHRRPDGTESLVLRAGAGRLLTLQMTANGSAAASVAWPLRPRRPRLREVRHQRRRPGDALACR